MPEDAPPKVEAAEAKAARKAASRAASQASAQPSLAGSRAEQGQPEVSSMAQADEPAAPGQEAGAELDGYVLLAAAAPLDELTPVSRQPSPRRLRTPKSHAAAEEEAGTPAPSIPVPQDSSPHLGESPGLGGVGAAANSGAAATTPRSYSFRPSTLKKSRQSLGGTPLHKENSASAAGRGRMPQASLSPTEQSIRLSLRRSARKSRGAT